MIKLEIFEQDGATAVRDSEWRDSEAGAMRAYRMRWLARSDRWARTTDRFGKVTTNGQVPQGEEAPRGRYVIHSWREDGDYASADPFHVMPASATASRAEDYRLDHRMGGNGELVTTWETEAELNARAARKDAAATARRAEAINARPLTGPRAGAPQCQAESAGHACALDGDGHKTHRDGAFTWAGPEPSALTPAEAIKPAILAMYGATVTDPGVHDLMIVNFPSVRDAASWVGASGLDQATCQLRDMDGWGPCTVLVSGVHSTAKAARKFTMEQAHAALAQVGSELAANADEISQIMDEADAQAEALDRSARSLEISEPKQGPRLVTRRGDLVAFLKWSGNVIKVYFPGGTILGRLYRSDGRRVGGETIYTYRAWTASDALECKPADTEVARGASLPMSVATLLQHAADAGRQTDI